ncbi:MAG: hypothetical protein ABI678_04455 [Kofleriaceae bacterium]
MSDEAAGQVLGMFLGGMAVTENVMRAQIRGEAARAAGRWLAVTPLAACEVRAQGKARGAKPVFRIRLATREVTSTREMVEWVGDVGETDYVFVTEDGIEIAIDPRSLDYLEGLTLDFVAGAFRLDRLPAPTE